MNIYRYYYDHLESDEAKLLYCELYDGLMKFDTVIICEYIPSWDDCMDDVIDALWMDNSFMSIFWDTREVRYYAYEGDEIVVTINYHYSKELCKQMLDAVQVSANKCLRECGALEPGIDDYTKLERLHDYLAIKCEYDLEAKGKSDLYVESYNAAGCLIDHNCVCEGSADAFKLLCDALNVPCIFIKGTLVMDDIDDADNAGHAWCYAFVGTSWWHIDISQGIANTKGNRVCRRWFMLDEDTNRIDHANYELPFPRNAWINTTL